MITVCLVITNYDINGQNNENAEKRVVRLSFLMKGRVIMNLVIAERPSVAQSIAKVIGATTKHDLPILPTDWLYQVSPGTKKQFQILKDLMKREDVDCVTNACDAGREGELIFRLVYEKAGCKKPIKRLWISSMEDEAIKKGFENLKDGKEYDALYEAALCRERADWMVGLCRYDGDILIISEMNFLTWFKTNT